MRSHQISRKPSSTTIQIVGFVTTQSYLKIIDLIHHSLMFSCLHQGEVSYATTATNIHELRRMRLVIRATDYGLSSPLGNNINDCFFPPPTTTVLSLHHSYPFVKRTHHQTIAETLSSDAIHIFTASRVLPQQKSL